MTDIATSLWPTAVGASTGFRIGGLGDSGTWLLSGPPATDAPEELISHLARLGLPPVGDGIRASRAQVLESGLQGRGGGCFPLASKLDAALLAPGEPLVVVNASESEPASRKDWTLCCHRPHLVLDGAAVVAAIVGSGEVVIHLHRGATRATAAMERAIAERRAAGLSDPRWRVSLGPDRYVAGESSAIASLLQGGEARPLFSAVPMALRGPSGRPTVVNNAETMAHVGLITRTGVPAWRSGGTPSSPGPRLLTLVGSVPDPGMVVELIGQATIGEILSESGHGQRPAGVLVGGYAGTWIDGDIAWRTPFDRVALDCLGAQPGCGLLGVLPHGSCGLSETARLVTYLSAETAGQCGPCVNGLPRLAKAFSELAVGSLRQRGLRRLILLGDAIEGGGACRHPDGVVQLVRSALEVFMDDVARHVAGRSCRGAAHPPVFQVPDVDLRGRGWQ